MEINFEDLAELQVDVLDFKDKVSDNFVSANDSGIDLKVKTSYDYAQFLLKPSYLIVL